MGMRVLYDGDCGFCGGWAGWIARRDRRQRFTLVPLDADPEIESCPAELRALDSLLLFDGHRWHAQSSAVCRILWGMGPVWALPGLLLWLVPRPLRNLGYDFVARRRHRSSPTDS